MRFALASLLMLLVASAKGDDLYVFTRTGCSPCDRLKAAIADHPDILVGLEVYKVDAALRPDIATKWRVTGVPVVILVRNGREIRRRVGFTTTQDLRDWLDDAAFKRSFR